MQTPPEFRPKTYVPVRNKIITTVGIILLSGVVGFGAGYAGSHLSNNANVTIQQQTNKSNSGTVQVSDVSDIVEKCKDNVVEITTESVSSGNSILDNTFHKVPAVESSSVKMDILLRITM